MSNCFSFNLILISVFVERIRTAFKPFFCFRYIFPQGRYKNGYMAKLEG